MADDRAQGGEGLVGTGGGPIGPQRRELGLDALGDGLALGLDAERDAALGGRLPLEGVEAVDVGLDGDEGLVALAALVGEPVQDGDAERRHRRDDGDHGGDQKGALALHLPGVVGPKARRLIG